MKREIVTPNADIAEGERAISETKFEIVRWTVGAQLAFAALMVATKDQQYFRNGKIIANPLTLG